MALRLAFTLFIALALLGAAFGAPQRRRPAETQAMSVDTHADHEAAAHLRELNTELANGRKLKGIKRDDVERHLRAYDDLRQALKSAQEKERDWLLKNGEKFEQADTSAGDFFAQINEAMTKGELHDDVVNELVFSTKQKRADYLGEQDRAMFELERTQADTREAAAQLAEHIKEMASFAEHSKKNTAAAQEEEHDEEALVVADDRETAEAHEAEVAAQETKKEAKTKKGGKKAKKAAKEAAKEVAEDQE